jgi:hypothetical protein
MLRSLQVGPEDVQQQGKVAAGDILLFLSGHSRTLWLGKMSLYHMWVSSL